MTDSKTKSAPKYSQEKLIEKICHVISSCITEDKKWTNIVKIKSQLNKDYNIPEEVLNKKLKQYLAEMEKKKIIVKKRSAISFCCKETESELESLKNSSTKKNQEDQPKKYLGPDVYITMSGRVAVLNKNEDEYDY